MLLLSAPVACGDEDGPQEATGPRPTVITPTSAPTTASTAPAAPGTTRGGPVAVRRWKVYQGDTLVLDVADQPGPIVSTAALPPDPAYVPPTNPYLTASAHHPGSESEVQGLLQKAGSVDEFLALLRAAGFRVVEVTGPGG